MKARMWKTTDGDGDEGYVVACREHAADEAASYDLELGEDLGPAEKGDFCGICEAEAAADIELFTKGLL
jgi:hypothetical protein